MLYKTQHGPCILHLKGIIIQFELLAFPKTRMTLADVA